MHQERRDLGMIENGERQLMQLEEVISEEEGILNCNKVDLAMADVMKEGADDLQLWKALRSLKNGLISNGPTKPAVAIQHATALRWLLRCLHPTFSSNSVAVLQQALPVIASVARSCPLDRLRLLKQGAFSTLSEYLTQGVSNKLPLLRAMRALIYTDEQTSLQLLQVVKVSLQSTSRSNCWQELLGVFVRAGGQECHNAGALLEAGIQCAVLDDHVDSVIEACIQVLMKNPVERLALSCLRLSTAALECGRFNPKSGARLLRNLPLLHRSANVRLMACRVVLCFDRRATCKDDFSSPLLGHLVSRAIAVLVDIVSNVSFKAPVWTCAAECLSDLVGQYESRQLLAKSSLPYVLNVLRSFCDECPGDSVNCCERFVSVKTSSLRLLASLCSASEALRTQVVSAISTFLRILKESNVPALRAQVCIVLRNISRSLLSARKSLVECSDLTTVLLSLCGEGTVTRFPALEVLCNLAVTMQSMKNFEFGGKIISALIDWAFDGEHNIREVCACAIANLLYMSEVSCRKAIYHEMGQKRLLRILKDDVHTVREQGIYIIRNLFCGKFGAEIADEHVAEAIVGAIAANLDTHSPSAYYALNSVCSASDQLKRAVIMRNGLLKGLLNATLSPSADIRLAAVWCLYNLTSKASKSDAAREACRTLHALNAPGTLADVQTSTDSVDIQATVKKILQHLQLSQTNH